MAVRNEYKTKQMSLLSDYFKSIPGTHFTVSDALAYLRFRDGCALAMAFSAAAVTTPGTQPAEPEIVESLLKQVVIEEM